MREDETNLFQENPWHRDYRAKLCGLAVPTMRDRAYTFLISSSLNELRALGRKTRKKLSVLKNAVVCYLLLKAQAVISSGEADWSEFFCEAFQDFWANPSKIFTQVCIAPSDMEIREFALDYGESSMRFSATIYA